MEKNSVVSGLPEHVITSAVQTALAEDLGLVGDITAIATVPEDVRATATLGARKPGVIAGIDVARAAFHAVDPNITFEAMVEDGNTIRSGDIVVKLTGKARALLMAERVALNFLSHLSGIATETRAFVDKISHTQAKIIDTRKTTPGLRALEKYAVRAGGGANHRFGLFDAVLIKDNHIVASGGIKSAVEAARQYAGHMVKVEVEVDNLAQLEEAIVAGANVVMLDNMSTDQLTKAVELVDGRAITEASGGVNLETVREIAETGVDLVSVGAVTHSAPILDLGLDFS